MNLISFFVLKIYPVFLETYGLSITMWFCSSFCALGMLYIVVFLSETKGKSIDIDENEK